MASTVRFDDECVLIPEAVPVRRPMLVTKSYSLWKKRSARSPSPGDSPEALVDDEHVTLKVPLPSFMATRRSISATRSPEFSPRPCLVHRSPISPSTSASASTSSHSTSLNTPPSPISRRPFQKAHTLADISTFHSHGSPSERALVTIPLRPCCAACFPITEECIQRGEEWVEKFSRGARRLRIASGSSDDHTDHRHSTRFPLTVDEVDKIRKSLEINVKGDAEPATPCSPSETGMSNQGPPSPLSPVSPSSVATEEDVDQLFPLPSPRRSPASSASGSPNASTQSVPDILSSAPSLSRCDKGFLKPSASLSPRSPTFSSIGETSPPLPQRTSSPAIAIPGRGRKAELYHVKASSGSALDSSDSDIHLNGFSRDDELPPLAPPDSFLNDPHYNQRPWHIRRGSEPASDHDSPGSPSSSPTRRLHIHLPTRHALLKVGEEMLKGVSAISSPQRL